MSPREMEPSKTPATGRALSRERGERARQGGVLSQRKPSSQQARSATNIHGGGGAAGGCGAAVARPTVAADAKRPRKRAPRMRFALRAHRGGCWGPLGA